MTLLSTKELYAIFLQSEWWLKLSHQKRSQVGFCQDCGSTRFLQCHHIRYPDHWFDTKLSDLRVLCRPCHEKVHQLKPSKPFRVFQQSAKQRRKEKRKRRMLGIFKKRKKAGLKNSVARFRMKPFHNWVSRGTSSN